LIELAWILTTSLASMVAKAVITFDAGRLDWFKMEWLPPERARFSSNQRGKSCSQFARRLAHTGRDVKSDFSAGP
jgi:hypothetical protein